MQGYSSTFLKLFVPLPTLSDAQKADAARTLDTNSLVVPYTNFSLAISKSRRVAFYTAVNIDGKKFQPVTRTRDKWAYDTRIDKAFQIGGMFYRGSHFDQGHLVRRLDPSWGTLRQAKRGIIDTFHYTNCAPQRPEFNRKEWGDLEDYLLKNTDKQDIRANVFTGPVFRADDPLVKNVQVPVDYWKVAVLIKPDGTPSATAYLQTQRNFLGQRDFEFGAFRTYQVKVSEIQRLTGLTFADLDQHDPLARLRDLEPGRELKSHTDIVL